MSEITDLNVTDASNTSISGVSAQGTSAASNMDNLVRAIAGMLARMNAGTAPLADTFTLGDNADLTKRFRFEASGITAGQTRVVTIPDANITLVSQTSPAFLTSFSVSGTASGAMGTLTSTEAGASGGPGLELLRNSASPAVNDVLGYIDFGGRDSGGAAEVYARAYTFITSPTAAAESGVIVLQTVQAGTIDTRFSIGGGFYAAGVTDPGAGNIAASNFYIGSVAMQATQADMETGSSTSLVTTPGRQQFHPGHPKFWAWVTMSAGVPTLTTSYNVTSITDTNIGQLTVTIATDFTNANFACVVSTGAATSPNVSTKAAGSVLVLASADPSLGYSVVGFGDQP